MSRQSYAELDFTMRSTAERETLPIRVVSVPSAHPYVERIMAANGVISLPDPIVAGAPPGQWWPPAALNPAWIHEHAASAEVLHIHFGTESFTPWRLVESIRAAREVGWPVVQTVHDLEHPQLADQAPYQRQLEVMLPLVDAVITLTPGAAHEIERRWERTALVLPHPRLLASIPEVAPRPTDYRVVGMYLKDIRPNIDAAAITTNFIAAIRELRATGMRVSGIIQMHRDVRDAPAAQDVKLLLAYCSEVRLMEVERLDDQALVASLNQLDVCVLPYSHGTHSGWLELCWDLALPVAAPTVGFYAEQHRDSSVCSFERGSVDSLVSALRRLLGADDASVTKARTSERHEQQRLRWASRLAIDSVTAEAHANLYRELVRRIRAA